MNDSELVRRCQRGDGAAFRQLYERHVRLALRTAYGVLRDQKLAEDAVQEAFIRVFNNIGKADHLRPFGAWLTRIVVNESIRLAQWRQKGGDPAEIPDHADPTNTERMITQWEVGDVLRECMALLPPILRAMLTLKYYQNMTDPEIAETMECPVGTVKSRLAKARDLVRQACIARGLDWSLEES